MIKLGPGFCATPILRWAFPFACPVYFPQRQKATEKSEISPFVILQSCLVCFHDVSNSFLFFQYPDPFSHNRVDEGTNSKCPTILVVEILFSVSKFAFFSGIKREIFLCWE